MVSCERSYMSTEFEGADCLQMKIIKAKCNKCKEYMSLENTNHVEIYVVHTGANKTKLMRNFCDA